MCCAVSQFTLYGILKGNKPDFHVAMSPDKAKPFYNSVVERFGKAYRTDAVKGIHFSFLVSSLECEFLVKHLESIHWELRLSFFFTSVLGS